MVNNTPEICRTCLIYDNTVLPIYETKISDKESVADVLQNSLNLSVTEFDGLPQNVCPQCLNDLKQCYLFRLKCLNSEKMLKELENNERVETEIVQLEPMLRNDIAEVKEEIITPKQIPPAVTLSCFVEIPAENLMHDPEVRLELSTNELNIDTESQSNRTENDCTNEINNYTETQSNRSENHSEIQLEISTNEINNDTETLSNRTENNSEIQLKLSSNKINTDTETQSNTKEAETFFKCKICEKEFKKKRYLTKHSGRCRPGKIRKTPLTKKPTFRCKPCQKEFPNHRLFIDHKRKLHQMYDCDVCEKSFIKHSTLLKHKVVHAGATKLSDKPVRTDKTANKSNNSTTNIKTINKKSKKEKRYECTICHKILSSPFSLKRHTISHSILFKKSNYKCDICDRSFKVASFLDRHRSTHSDDHKCEFCNRTFPNEIYLKNHMLRKHDDKNLSNIIDEETVEITLPNNERGNILQCTICFKEFASYYYLRRHMRFHTGEKPFSCEICKKSYTQRQPLKTHILQKHSNIENNNKSQTVKDKPVTKNNNANGKAKVKGKAKAKRKSICWDEEDDDDYVAPSSYRQIIKTGAKAKRKYVRCYSENPSGDEDHEVLKALDTL